MSTITGRPCDVNGFLYKQNQMPAGQIDRLLDLWASTLTKHNDNLPFADHCDLYHVIDSSPFGDVPWQHFTVSYDGERLADKDKPWMDSEYEVWFCDPREVACNMLANSTYTNEIDYCPYREYSTKGEKCQWKDFMSGDWVWDQADEITKDPSTLGSTFVPVILGSDKMTVSVGTGNNEYYPLYASIGNIHNNLFHSSLSKILNPLKPGMMTPEVTCFGDGHYRRVIYGLGPYIANYEEQVLLACIVHNWCPKCVANREDLDEDVLPALVEEAPSGDLWEDFGIVTQLVPFTNDFPQANIHQMISPDILHQLIQAAFKDYLMTWVKKYLRRGFKQWTGDDSKALMKVYLPAIEGHVPQDIICAFRALLDICYLVRRNIITEDSLLQIEDTLSHFHHYREIFRTTGVVLHFSLPRQHSLMHYNKHIKAVIVVSTAVKEPWRRSSRYNALGQILLINQQLDKLSALRVDFMHWGMLTGTCLSAVNALEGKNRAQTIPELADELDIPHLSDLIRCFLFQQTYPDDPCNLSDIPLAECPLYLSKIAVFNSASSRFYAPSDLSGIGGMRTEHIRSCPSWRGGHSRNDCVFVNTDSSLPGMQGLKVAHVRTFFSFQYRGEVYPCVVVCWFDKIGNAADEDTGMWMVRPGEGANNTAEYAIIHIDAIYRAAHLIPMYGMEFLPPELKFYHSYDAFCAYYVNKYADHHAFEIAF
ncbi:hypothetical protein C8R48DRAFT_747864 [Suillus tomentosus]|nr:hypothetical protein C8R48DRAFT_747864 [Suillus tomentosus]